MRGLAIDDDAGGGKRACDAPWRYGALTMALLIAGGMASPDDGFQLWVWLDPRTARNFRRAASLVVALGRERRNDSTDAGVWHRLIILACRGFGSEPAARDRRPQRRVRQGMVDRDPRDERDVPREDLVKPPLTRMPDRELEAQGRLRCRRCGAPARWQPWGDVWVPACEEHAPEDDST